MRRPFHSAGETCTDTDGLPGSQIVLVFVFQLTSWIEQAFHPAESSLKCEKAVPPSSQNTHVGRKIRPCGHNNTSGKGKPPESRIVLVPGFSPKTPIADVASLFCDPGFLLRNMTAFGGLKAHSGLIPCCRGGLFPTSRGGGLWPIQGHPLPSR